MDRKILKQFAKHFGRLKTTLKKVFFSKTGIAALCMAFLMSFGGILITNLPYSIGNKMEWFSVIENFIRRNDIIDKNDAYFINVGYDKQLVNVPMINKQDTGQIVITNRKTLLDFLTIAEKADYKYIFLDIRFEQDCHTEYDELLFSKIQNMENVLYTSHFDDFAHKYIRIYDSNKQPKYAYNDYYTTIFDSNFSKYQYIQDGRISVALRIYQDITGKTMTQKWTLLYNDGNFFLNSPVIPIRGDIIDSDDEEYIADYQYHNLGPKLLTLPEEELVKYIKGKMVFLGDFNEDIHDTYMDSQSGPFLTYLAYKYLLEGKNKVQIWLHLILMVVFFIIVRNKIGDEPDLWLVQQFRKAKSFLKDILPKCINSFITRIRSHRITNFFVLFTFEISAIYYTLIFFLICYGLYIMLDMVYNILIPSITLSLIDVYKKSKERNKSQKI